MTGTETAEQKLCQDCYDGEHRSHVSNVGCECPICVTPAASTEARGLGEFADYARSQIGPPVAPGCQASFDQQFWWRVANEVDAFRALLAEAAAPEKCIACENGQILQTDRTQKTCGLCGGTGLAAAPETEGQREVACPTCGWSTANPEWEQHACPGPKHSYDGTGWCSIHRSPDCVLTDATLPAAQPAAEGAREDDGLATAIELAVLMTEADCASAEYPFSDLSRAKALLPWLAEDRRRARAEGGAEALEEAADDLLLDCSHFNRYRGKPEWCGYCESAVNMLRDRAAGLRETGA